MTEASAQFHEPLERLSERTLDHHRGLVSLMEELARTVEGGYPVIRHVERLIEGPIVWAPALTGGIVMSLRGGDVSLGYLDHDRATVHLYLEESVTFQLVTPEAAVPLQVAG